MEKKIHNKGVSSLATPIAIVIAGVLISTVLYFNGQVPTQEGVNDRGQQAQAAAPAPQANQKPGPVTSSDHIKGDTNAFITIVEYSDSECPFCKRFHNTMNQVIDEYGTDGDVAWVYRQFPLDTLHPKNARAIAVASECAAELGGNEAFWQFTDGFYSVTPSNDRTDLATVIPKLISDIGLDSDAFNTCIASGKYDQHIQENIDEAVATGGRGTPWSIVMTKNGDTFTVNGAQPYSAVKAIIDAALKTK